jgi:paraquat-inducible protein A
MHSELVNKLLACTHCGLIQKLPQKKSGNKSQQICCYRCSSPFELTPGLWRQLSTSKALALSALMIYPFGILLPIMEIERFGHIHKASVWDGTISLITHGQIFIGIVVFICSVVFPLLKLGGIFTLCLELKQLNQLQKSKIFNFVENVGKWGMIDVLLVAILVATVKLGDMVNVSPGIGSTAFGLCVVLSILASLSFNPANIWKEQK